MAIHIFMKLHNIKQVLQTFFINGSQKKCFECYPNIIQSCTTITNTILLELLITNIKFGSL